MKRKTGFWEEICAPENIAKAYHKCTLGKGFYREIKEIGENHVYYEDEVLRLSQVSGLAEAFADRKFSEAWECDFNDENPEVIDETSVL